MPEFSIVEQQMLTKGMTDQQKMLFRTQYDSVRKDRGTILILSVLFGTLGVDRFMIGDMGMGLLKLFTAGACGVLWLIDIFTIRGKVDEYNRKQANDILYGIKILSNEEVSDVRPSQPIEAEKIVEAPIMSSPAEYVGPEQATTFIQTEAPLATSGLSQKNIILIVGGAIAVAVVILLIVFVSKISNKQEIAPPAPVAMPSANTSDVPQSQDGMIINVGNIRPLTAPSVTSGYLTEMLINNSNPIKLLELKANIEQLFPRPDKGDVKSARALNEKGLVLFRQENYLDASSLFLEATKQNPADIEALNNYAYALLKAGKYEESEKVLGTVLSFAPSRTSAWANLADVYANENRQDSSSAAFVVGFQFATNKDKALEFLKNTADSDPNEKLRDSITRALAQLSKN